MSCCTRAQRAQIITALERRDHPALRVRLRHLEELLGRPGEIGLVELELLEPDVLAGAAAPRRGSS